MGLLLILYVPNYRLMGSLQTEPKNRVNGNEIFSLSLLNILFFIYILNWAIYKAFCHLNHFFFHI